MTRLQSARAVYREGRLVFATPNVAPKDGTEVVVTYAEELPEETASVENLIGALRGRGKGERLTEKLLLSRREDRERDEREF